MYKLATAGGQVRYIGRAYESALRSHWKQTYVQYQHGRHLLLVHVHAGQAWPVERWSLVASAHYGCVPVPSCMHVHRNCGLGSCPSTMPPAHSSSCIAS